MKTRRANAYLVFFPLTAVYGMLFMPASVYALTTGHDLMPGMRTPLNHAHELLFGYGMGVAAGYLMNNVPVYWIAGMLGLWGAARLSYLLMPFGDVALITNLLFALGFMVIGASRFLPAAKKWRNRAFAIAAAGVGLSAALALPAMTDRMTDPALPVYEGVLMIALLMLLMGGRFIAPAAAGHIEKHGGSLEARVQPHLEAAIILLMLTGSVAVVRFPHPAGIAILAAGLTAGARLLRWRLWECRDRFDLVSLGVGYAWIAVGLVSSGISLVLGLSPIVAVHAITVGGIGTLTLTVMARTWLQRSGVAPADHSGFLMITALVALSASLRLAAGLVPSRLETTTLLTAAGCWSLALLLLIGGVFWPYPGRRQR